jgi:protein-tyrosine-phosphatase/DNA-binding transcriptional ArsR family regulator
MASAEVPAVLGLAAHPVRWRLLGELAGSDRQVHELTEALGVAQNLVSYHLGQLRTGGLVTSRRSSADARDTYYRLDLARCGQLLADAGGALHPALRLAPPSATVHSGRKVLFLCTGNSARSQMAEALLRKHSGGAVAAYSAGSHPKPLHRHAIRAMKRYGVDLSGARTKHLDEYARRRFDYVITLCDKVREVCPEFPGRPVPAHWSVPDPAREPDGYPAFQRVAADLDTRVGFLLHQLDRRVP